MVKSTLKVALVNPPIPEGVYHHQPYLPLGLAYLAASLESFGFDVSVIDCPATGVDFKSLEKILSNLMPSIIGITSMTPTIKSALSCAKSAKNACKDALVILGGPHASFMDEDILAREPSVDVIVRGEAEATIVELAKCLSENKKFHDVAGITFRHNNRIVRNQDRGYIQNLDELPFPDYDHFELKKYELFGRRLLPIMSSRGCPFQCSFCVTSRIFGRIFRARSPKNVVDELSRLESDYGADAFTFYDDTLTLSRDRILKICREMQCRKLNLPWDCQTRADAVSKEILIEMKKAGCQQIFFGVESGSQKILDAIGKGTTVEQNERAIKMAKEVGLFVSISVIIGYPGETIETINQTMKFIKKTKPDDVYICVATPYPGTQLYEQIKNLGWSIFEDWDKFDTTNLVFAHPLITADALKEFRQKFYDDFY
ncbi:MAG: radical SAM protein, partial [Candidatus Bathyarchaeia archaeon]